MPCQIPMSTLSCDSFHISGYVTGKNEKKINLKLGQNEAAKPNVTFILWIIMKIQNPKILTFLRECIYLNLSVVFFSPSVE